MIHKKAVNFMKFDFCVFKVLQCIFIFLTSILRYQRFMSFKKAQPLNKLFSLCMMFRMHFDNVSVLLISVAAA